MAAGPTYEPIATNTLGSAAASVTFSSITGTYTDLVLIVEGTPVTAGTYNLEMRFNGDTGSNYSRTQISGDGTIADSTRASNQTKLILTYNASLASTKSNQIINILNYSNTTTFKTVLARANRASSGTDFIVNLYRSTSAITSIDIFLTGSNLQTGSTFTLYGIKAA